MLKTMLNKLKQTMLKTTNAEFSIIEIWFTDQNNRNRRQWEHYTHNWNSLI